jgi:hypothetical protein
MEHPAGFAAGESAIEVGSLYWRQSTDGGPIDDVGFAVLNKHDRVAMVRAYDNELVEVGYLKWMVSTDEDGMITWVEVKPAWQRKKVATVMWELAHQVAAEQGWHSPHHTADRTLEGNAWAQAVGGELPDLKLIQRQDQDDGEDHSQDT